MVYAIIGLLFERDNVFFRGVQLQINEGVFHSPQWIVYNFAIILSVSNLPRIVRTVFRQGIILLTVRIERLAVDWLKVFRDRYYECVTFT